MPTVIQAPPTLDWILQEMSRLGHVVFDGPVNYDLNFVGVRQLPGEPNKFDDWITCFYRLNGPWRYHCWQATTDPGMYYLRHPERLSGTAILIPGQYRRCWQLGLHHGEYPALTQLGSVFRVWRDRNLNNSPDYTGRVYTDVAGLNLHKAGRASTQVDRYSAGCQVLANLSDWNELIALPGKQIQSNLGNKFSYTLLTRQTT